MEIREALDVDAATINAIYNATVATTTVAWTEEHESLGTRRDWMHAQRLLGHPVLVAATDDERQGFAVVGRLLETGFKFGRWLELVLMERIFAP